MVRFTVLPRFLDDAALREALLALGDASPGWAAGRQGTGYEKLPLQGVELAPPARALLARSLALLGVAGAGAGGPWDAYLLRYRAGAGVPGHVDPAVLPGCVHLRLNAVVRPAVRGGGLVLDGEAVALGEGDGVLFRPDAVRHEVLPVEVGERVVWSVGCNRAA